MSETFFDRRQFAWLLLVVVLLICSCRQKSPPTQAEAPPPPGSPPSTAPPPPRKAAQATPEQLASVVRVRVAFGGLPPRDTAAALLHRDEIPDQSLAQGRCRFVLALLKGWEEKQLRGADARIIVYRNLLGRNGQSRTVPETARLVQFDPATWLGVLACYENSGAFAGAGFRLPHGGGTPADLLLLRTFQDAASGFSVDAGRYRLSKTRPAAVELPTLDPPAVADPVQIAASGADVLEGFVEGTSAGAPLTPLAHWAVALRPPRFDVTQAAFNFRYGAQAYELHCTVGSESGEPAPGQFSLHLRETAPAELANWLTPDVSGAYLPISSRAQILAQQGARSTDWRATLLEPVMDQQSFYLMQLSWPLLPLPGAPEIYGQPFIVKFERNAGKLTGTLLDQPPPVPAEPAAGAIAGSGHDEPAVLGEATPFPLGGAAKEVHLIAGGREALIHLDTAPYWKRFSFEKNDWLPLPAANLASVSLTGNLTALFILDPATREVRRFKLPNLEPSSPVRLPPADYLAILAGCDSEHAPVFVTTAADNFPLDPVTLQWENAPEQKTPGPTPYYLKEPASYFITGDGLGFVRVSQNARPFYHYNSSTRGPEYPYLGLLRTDAYDEAPGVTAGFTLGNGVHVFDTPGGVPAEAGLPSQPWTYAASELSENAPVVFRLLRPDRRRDALPKTPRLGCFAFSSALPFAETDAPELINLTDNLLWKKDRWAFIDPYSRKVATLSTDRRTWCVRSLPRGEPRRQPVLLNWPDSTVPRGGKFSFQPQLAGGKEFTAGVLGQTETPTIDATAGTLLWPFLADDIASLQLLTFNVPGADGTRITYPVLLHAAGPEIPFFASPAVKAEGLNERGAELASLGAPNNDFHPLAATLYQLPAPVMEIVGPVADSLVLITADRLDFFSLQTRRIIGSTARPAAASYYPGAGALLEYDPGKRTLIRISVPDARREAPLPFPAGITLRGIGAGTERGSPVTLAIDIVLAQSILRFSDRTFTDIAARQALVVLDGQTLRSQGRTQPTSLSRLLGKPEAAGGDSFGFIGELAPRPVVLPTSRDGSMVDLPRYFVALGPGYGVLYPFGQDGAGMDLASLTSGLSGGSLSGLMAFSASGQAYKGGTPLGKASGSVQELGATPAGRYQFQLVNAGRNKYCVDVLLAESGHPLLRMGRIPFLGSEQFFGTLHPSRRVLMLGENGPLAILSGPGRTLELVDLDIAAAARRVASDEFHVVSQPAPIVMEGRWMQYQVRVNNPAAVQSMHLQSTVSGASLSPAGVLTYTAPHAITGPTHVTISIEITGRNGQAVLHEFPIYVLPWPRTGTTGKTGEV